jgi:hypothetical protein
MSNNHWIKIGVFALIIVGIAAFPSCVTDTAWRVLTTGVVVDAAGRQQSQCRAGLGSKMTADKFHQRRPVWRLPVLFGQSASGDARQVPTEVVDALNAVLADEHNAYNTYQAVMDQFGTVRPFANISRPSASYRGSEFLFGAMMPLPEITRPKFPSLLR